MFSAMREMGGRRRCAVVAAVPIVLVALLAVAEPAAARQQALTPSAGEAAEASVALETAEQALGVADAPTDDPAPAGDQTGAPALDASVALNALATAVPQLRGGERRRARGLLARPTDGPTDQYGDGYPKGVPLASAESAHFCVVWVSDPAATDAPDLADDNGTADGDGVPDYVESLLTIAEHSYGVEVAPGALGWRAPKPDRDGCGASPATHADVYLEQLGKKGLFGYESPDPGQGRARSRYGYMVLDNDYAKSEYGYSDPAIPASVTFAHEFNHLLQQAYDSLQDPWMFESTATWVEDKVYPEINDYLFYMPAFAGNPGAPLSDLVAGRGLRVYGLAAWNHWLDSGDGGFGVDAIRRAWEVSGSVDPVDNAFAAYGRSIELGGGKGFSSEFVRFATATAEWRSGFGDFPDAASYPDVSRKGALRRGEGLSFALDHTAYRLLNVGVAGASGPSLTLSLKAPHGLRCGLALIGRDGSRRSGSVTQRVRYLDRGGRGSVTLADPGSYERITAVIVNADPRVEGRARGGDFVYAKDGVELSARLRD